MEKLLDPLAPNPEFPATLGITRRLLLTDAPWPESDTLKALRLERMIAFGASDEAARLYSFWSPENPDVRLLAVGAQALILSGQPSVACLEANSNVDDLQIVDKYIPRRHDLLPFCAGMIARESSDTAGAAASATPASTEETTKNPNSAKTEQASDVSLEDRKAEIFSASAPVFYPGKIGDLVDLGPIVMSARPYLPGISYARLVSWELPESLTGEDAGILARDSGLPLGLRLKLFARTGDITPPTPGPIPSTAPALPHGNADEIWAVIADLYQDQWAGAAQDANARTTAILDLFPHLPAKIQILFAPTFESINPNHTLNTLQNQALLTTLFEIDSPHVDSRMEKIEAQLPAEMTIKDHNPQIAALTLLATMRGHNVENTKIPFSFSQAKADGRTDLLKTFKNLSDLLDKPPSFIDNPPEVYEKKTSLTQADHYVIPVQVLRKNLREAKEKGQIGQTLLATLLFLQSQEPQEIDPGVLAQILDGLIAVGLTEEARQVATTVLLEVTQHKENQNGTSRPPGTTETKPASLN